MSESKEPHADDWLTKNSPEQWIRQALVELERAQAAFQARDAGAAIAHLKRAAGMALNGALIVRPDERWGRKYVEHLRALNESEEAPAEVREAARRLSDARAPGRAGRHASHALGRRALARGGAHGDGARLRHRARLARQERKTGGMRREARRFSVSRRARRPERVAFACAASPEPSASAPPQPRSAPTTRVRNAQSRSRRLRPAALRAGWHAGSGRRLRSTDRCARRLERNIWPEPGPGPAAARRSERASERQRRARRTTRSRAATKPTTSTTSPPRSATTSAHARSPQKTLRRASGWRASHSLKPAFRPTTPPRPRTRGSAPC